MDQKYYDALAQVRLESSRQLLSDAEGLLDGTFTREDYRMLSDADQIRSASDYDDFYIASKEETRQQVENATQFVRRVEDYFAKCASD